MFLRGAAILAFSTGRGAPAPVEYALAVCGAATWDIGFRLPERCSAAKGEARVGGWRMTRVGLYPGTFDPVTNGHIDIIGRAVKLVDTLVIGVAINAGKGPLFSLEERCAIVEE